MGVDNQTIEFAGSFWQELGPERMETGNYYLLQLVVHRKKAASKNLNSKKARRGPWVLHKLTLLEVHAA